MPTIAYDPSGAALLRPGNHAPFFVADRRPDDLQLAAEAARLAYLKFERVGPAALTEALGRAGFEAPTLFIDPASSTEGYGAFRPDDGLALLAFRGTDATRVTDLATDLKLLPTAWREAGGTVHAGFAAAMRSVKPAVDGWLDGAAKQRRRLLICGHSLGAAIATLAASIWRDAELVTLGSPRVGDAAFGATLEGRRITRIVDCCDLVTQLPLHSPWHAHVGTLRYIARDGSLPDAPSDAFIRDDQLRARVSFALEHALEVGSAGARDLADHAPVNYLRAFF